MSKLDILFSTPLNQCEIVIGTYLYPYVLLGEPDWNDAYSATEIIKDINIDSEEVLLTRNGGLFIKTPDNLKTLIGKNASNITKMSNEDFQDKLLFQEKAINIFNDLICEFALNGVVSAPTTHPHISSGKLIENHALILSGGGGREMYLERTTQQLSQLREGSWRNHTYFEMHTVEEVIKLQCTSKLSTVSDNIPTFVASAYSLFSQGQLSVALSDSWIVIEQIVNSLWEDYLKTLKDNKRKERLQDTRTYTTAVRIEVLFSKSKLPESLYEQLNIARKHRNDLLHSATIDKEMAWAGLIAMKQMIEFFCGKTIEPPNYSEGINW